MTIRISALDRLFSLVIRSRDHWTCQRCGTRYSPPTNALHCAHIFTRSKKSTRFDELNAVAWCYGCHSYLDRNPLEKYAWYKTRFGAAQFNLLHLRSNLPAKLDLKLTELVLRQRLKDLRTKETQ